MTTETLIFLTEEERKKDFVWDGNNWRFTAKIDLSGEVEVEPIYEDEEPSQESLASDVAVFIADFVVFTYPRLNGFGGFDNIRWKIK